MTAKDWCFTIHEIRDVKWNPDTMTYLVYQEEVCPETKKHHIQGFVQLKQRKRMNQVKDILNCQSAHLEKRRGTAKEASDYCKKEDSRAPDGLQGEHGELQFAGKRTDIKKAVEAIKEGKTYFDLTEDDDTIEVAAKYPKFCKELEAHIKEKKASDEIMTNMKDMELREWQKELDNYLDNDPDDRQVTWVFDEVGNTGKSWMARYIEFVLDGVSIMAGRYQDMAYMWRQKQARIVVIDLARNMQREEKAQDPLHGMFQFIESVKNGLVMSPKYECVRIIHKPPHVVVFANFRPDKSRLSHDRWNIVDVTPKQDNLEMNYCLI